MTEFLVQNPYEHWTRMEFDSGLLLYQVQWNSFHLVKENSDPHFVYDCDPHFVFWVCELFEEGFCE